MNLRSGRIISESQPIPKKKHTRRMVNTTNDQGGQNPPQGSGTVGTSSTTSSQAIPTSIGSMAATNSNPPYTGTAFVASLANVPPFGGTSESLSNTQNGPILTYVGGEIPPSSPHGPPGFKKFRPWKEQA